MMILLTLSIEVLECKDSTESECLSIALIDADESLLRLGILTEIMFFFTCADALLFLGMYRLLKLYERLDYKPFAIVFVDID